MRVIESITCVLLRRSFQFDAELLNSPPSDGDSLETSETNEGNVDNNELRVLRRSPCASFK